MQELIDVEFKLTKKQDERLMKYFEREQARKGGNYTFDEFINDVLDIVFDKLEHEKQKMNLE